MDSQLFRPLIKLNQNGGEQFEPYLNLASNYEISEIVALRQYLPTIFKFVGVEAQGELSQQSKKALAKRKIKLQGINGVEVGSKDAIEFYHPKDLIAFEWQVCIVLWIPVYEEIPSKQVKQQLTNFLQSYFSTNFKLQIEKGYFAQSEKILKSELQKSNLIFPPFITKSCSLHNKIKKIEVTLQIRIILQNSDKYPLDYIINLIKLEFVNSLNLMIQYSYPNRLLAKDSKSSLFLQNFCKNQDKIQQQKMIQDLILEQRKSQISNHQKTNFDKPQQSAGKKETKSKELLFLIFSLVALVAGYLFLKYKSDGSPSQNAEI